MATNAVQKPGLTTFGWLALGATAAAVLASPARRDKLAAGARDLFDSVKKRVRTEDPASPAA
jgi:hypothetical protein